MFLEVQDITDLNEADILALKIAEAQRGFLETTSECLAEAKEEARYVPVGLYKGKLPVGFAMYGKFNWINGEPRVWLDRYFIDERYQGKGFGKYYLQVLIDHLVAKYHAERIYLSVYDDNVVAIQLYKKFDFHFNGELDENGEKIMVKEIESK